MSMTILLETLPFSGIIRGKKKQYLTRKCRAHTPKTTKLHCNYFDDSGHNEKRTNIIPLETILQTAEYSSHAFE